MTLPSLIESGIAEFDDQPWIITRAVNIDVLGERTGIEVSAREEFKAFLTSFATNVHNAAIESALEALPKEEKEPEDFDGYEPNDVGIIRFNEAIKEVRAKLSVLKKENV